MDLLLMSPNINTLVYLTCTQNTSVDQVIALNLSPSQTITTYRNIVGHNMLHAFGHPVVLCCTVLSVVGPNLTIFKLKPTTLNMLQHVTGQLTAS